MIRKPTLSDLIDWPHLANVLFAPPDRRGIGLWAQDFVCIPIPPFAAEFEGKMSFSKGIGPVGLKVLERLDDPSKRRVVLKKPTRGSGSLWADTWTMDIIARKPGDMLVNFPTDEEMLQFYKTRIRQFIEACEPVAKFLPTNRFDDSNTLIQFSHMNLYLQGASESKFRSKPARYARAEELWAWKRGMFQKLEGRLKDFAKLGLDQIFIQSQGGFEKDDLDIQWDLGSREILHVPCEKCGQYYPNICRGERPDGTWWGLCWADNEKFKTGDGHWIVEAVRSDFWYECPYCRHQDRREDAEAQKDWIQRCKFISTLPKGHTCNPGYDSLRYTSMICEPRWGILERWLLACNARHFGQYEPTQNFVQESEADTWSASYIEALEKFQRYIFGTEMADIAGHILTADRHGDGTNWVVVWQWSKSGHSRLIWYGVLDSMEDIEKKRIEYKIHPTLVGIDYGEGRSQRETLEICARYKWTGFWGAGVNGFREKRRVQVGAQVMEDYVRVLYKQELPSIELAARVRGGADARILDARAFRYAVPIYTKELYERLRGKFHAEPPVSPNPDVKSTYDRHMRSWRWNPETNAIENRDKKADHFWDASKMQLPLAQMKGLLSIAPDETKPKQ